MTIMTVVDVINIIYPNQLLLGNVELGFTNGFVITKWTVEGQSQPTIESLEALIPSLQSQFDYDYFVQIGTQQLMVFIDSVAAQKQYDSAVSCASYSSSSVSLWKAQADAFISWRDSVFTYTIAQVQLMQSGERSVPDFEDFKNELPIIAWPS